VLLAESLSGLCLLKQASLSGERRDVRSTVGVSWGWRATVLPEKVSGWVGSSCSIPGSSVPHRT